MQLLYCENRIDISLLLFENSTNYVKKHFSLDNAAAYKLLIVHDKDRSSSQLLYTL